MFKLFTKKIRKVTTKKWTLLNLDTQEVEIVIADSVCGAVTMGYFDVLDVEEVEIEE